MAKRQNIDSILKDWGYEPGEVAARVVRGSDGRDVLQMRIDMGLLQLEVDGRPDGAISPAATADLTKGFRNT